MKVEKTQASGISQNAADWNSFSFQRAYIAAGEQHLLLAVKVVGLLSPPARTKEEEKEEEAGFEIEDA